MFSHARLSCCDAEDITKNGPELIRLAPAILSLASKQQLVKVCPSAALQLQLLYNINVQHNQGVTALDDSQPWNACFHEAASWLMTLPAGLMPQLCALRECQDRSE